MKLKTLCLLMVSAASAITFTFDLNGDYSGTVSGNSNIVLSDLTDISSGLSGLTTTLHSTYYELDRTSAAGNIFSFTIQNNNAYDIRLDTWQQTVEYSNGLVQALGLDDASGARIFYRNGNAFQSAPDSGDSLIEAGATDSFFVEFNTNNTTSNTAIDSFTFTAVPEPSAITLGGLGLLTFALRRRRG